MKFRKIIACASALLIVAGCVSLGYSNCEKVSANGYGEIITDDYSMDLGGTGICIKDENGEPIESGAIRYFKSKNEKDTAVIPSAVGDMKILMLYPPQSISAENIILPSQLMFIRGNDFLEGCPNLKNIVIPDTVIEVDDMEIPSDVVIIGKRNSYAEQYAKKHSNEFRVLGDMNGDGKISTIDIISEIQYLLSLRQAEGVDRLAGDLNMDGRINIFDLLRMKQEVLEPLGSIYGSVSGLKASPELDSVERSYKKADTDGFVKFTADFSDNILLDAENEKGGVNPVYSPLSIYMALSALAECSETQTLDELLNVLNAESKEELRRSNKEIFEELYFDYFVRYCRITNSIWFTDRYAFEDDCLKRLADNYYSSAFVRDLGLQETSDDISKWIYQNTSGRFDPEILPDTDAIIRIINTVTFKEKWTDPFDWSSDGTFTRSDGRSVKCEMMNSSHSIGLIGDGSNFVKYTRFLKDDYQMSFILPEQGVSVEEILSDTDTMQEIFNDGVEMIRCDVGTHIPKFDVSSKFDILKTAEAVGLKNAFDNTDLGAVIKPENNPGFSGAYVDEFVHESAVTIDEKGCEASAYTEIRLSEETVPKRYFDADRPFIYYISDTNGTPIFVGVINDPTSD